MDQSERDNLRQSLREARRELSAEQQSAASNSLRELVSGQEFFTSADTLAFYQGMDGEIDPRPLLELALEQGKSCFLPILTDEEPQLVAFAPYDRDTELTENRWGIGEPPAQELLPPTNLDVVFVPLVGFDHTCFRLGMGKGYYDRTFSFKIFNRRSRPLLVGLAHECQLIEPFATASWDVRLDAVVTTEKIYRPNTA